MQHKLVVTEPSKEEIENSATYKLEKILEFEDEEPKNVNSKEWKTWSSELSKMCKEYNKWKGERIFKERKKISDEGDNIQE